MVRIKVRSWVMLSAYGSPHKDRRAEMCVCVCVRVYADLSFLSSQGCFLPSLKWAVGAFLHLSITEKDEEE